jgi:hypothetical protein
MIQGSTLKRICHLCVKDIKNPFCKVFFFAKMKLVPNVRDKNNAKQIWLLRVPSISKDVLDSGQDVAITGWGCRKEHCDFKESPRFLQEIVMTAIPNDLAMCW